MKRITEASAPTRGRVELLSGPDDRVLLEERVQGASPADMLRVIDYMNAQWHLMGLSPMPPTGIRIRDDHGHVVLLSRGPVIVELAHAGFRRNGRMLVDGPRCVACIEGRHQSKPTWHTWADDAVSEFAADQRCACECAGARTFYVREGE